MDSKNKNMLQKIISSITLIVLFILLVVIGINDIGNKDSETNTSGQYENIGIDTSKLNVFFLNAGQADSIFITINNKNMLIDAGNKSDGHYIAEFLKAQNITQIDYLFGTHIDEDHIGGMADIIRSSDVKNLYMPRSTYNEKDFYNNIEDITDIQETYIGATYKLNEAEPFLDYRKHV